MPIHAYACRACGKEFQTLVRGGETPECPACGGVELERQLSLIASTPKSGDAGPMAACGVPMGACGASACGCPALAD